MKKLIGKRADNYRCFPCGIGLSPSDYCVDFFEMLDLRDGQNKIWTREEPIIAFNVYCKIPFKSSSKHHPTIVKYAKLIGRSPSALNMKIGNLGRLDPELRKQGIVGLSHGSKTEEAVWEEFNGNWEELAYESELLVAEQANKNIEGIADVGLDTDSIPIGRAGNNS